MITKKTLWKWLKKDVTKSPKLNIQSDSNPLSSTQMKGRRNTVGTLGVRKVKLKLNQAQNAINGVLNKFMATLSKEIYLGDRTDSSTTLELIHELVDVKRTLDDLEKTHDQAQGNSSIPVYTISSWFLHECYQYLSVGDVESMHYVTGIQSANLFTLDKMVTFDMAHQSFGSAKGAMASTHKTLIQMDCYGHKLLAYFHIHPGSGEGATLPSSVDLNYQTRLDQGGYLTIGGIFSRDGYFRLFPEEREFHINIYGKGVTTIDEKQRLFRLVEVY
jgi:hypothetical protein